MKYSIQKQFALVICLLIIGTIGFCLLMNNLFLEDYYLKERQNALMSAYSYTNLASTENDLDTEEFDIELQKICNRNNISFILLDAETQTLKTSSNNYEFLSMQLLNNLFRSEEIVNTRLLEDGDRYTIWIKPDERTQAEFVEMWGMLDNGNLFLFRIPLEGIRESVKLANRFLVYIGACAVVLSVLIGLWLSGKIAKPIRELTKISERMIHLDFDAKYSGKSQTEIALLGHNINELSYTLEQTISELKTANNELQRDIEKKNEIDEMRKEFLSNVSHELKTPISLIQGYAEGLKEGINEDAESREFYCDVIMDETSKMNTMVKKLLTLNQLEFGNDTVSMERFDIVALIRNYIQSSEILTKQKEISVRMKDYAPIYVWAEEFKTEEVFMNYFTNAIHYASCEKIIDVKLEKRENKVRISVFNTGDPIPADSLPHLWEKFYKVDKARTREYGGTGIGLSIVKAIMESMNKEYGVINYDNGVEFWYELELA